MKKRLGLLTRSHRSHSGQGMIEYALLLALLAVALVGVVATLGPIIGQAVNNVSDGVSPDRPEDWTPIVPGSIPPAPDILTAGPRPSTKVSQVLDTNVYVVAYVPLFSSSFAF
jgi:Flp pilus assembly pilin Flp